MIERIRIRNYKAIRDVTVELGRINVLVGPNDSGKTSFLEAIGAMCRSVDEPMEKAFIGAWSGAELVTGGVPDLEVAIELTFAPGGHWRSYGWRCWFGTSGRTAIRTREWVEATPGVIEDLGSDSRVRWTAVRASTQGEPFGLRRISAEGAREIHRALGNVRFHRFDPAMLALPVAPDSSRRFRMDTSGFGLALCLDDILGFDRDAFAKIERQMRAIFPEFRGLRLVSQPAFRAPLDISAEVPALQVSDGKGLQFLFDRRGDAVPASQVSDGMLLVLAYLTLLSVPEPPRLLLIEEPENGIHPRRLKEVIGVIRDFVREQSETQVILTSHSPYVVDVFDPSEVYACRKDPVAGVVIGRLSDSPLVRDQIRHFTLGEIWVSEGEDRLVAALPPTPAPADLTGQVAEDGPAKP